MAKFLLPDNLNTLIRAEGLVVARDELGEVAQKVMRAHGLHAFDVDDFLGLRLFIEVFHDIASNPAYSPDLIPDTWVRAEALVAARDALGKTALDVMQGYGLANVKDDDFCKLHHLIGIFSAIAITYDHTTVGRQSSVHQVA